MNGNKRPIGINAHAVLVTVSSWPFCRTTTSQHAWRSSDLYLPCGLRRNFMKARPAPLSLTKLKLNRSPFHNRLSPLWIIYPSCPRFSPFFHFKYETRFLQFSLPSRSCKLSFQRNSDSSLLSSVIDLHIASNLWSWIYPDHFYPT